MTLSKYKDEISNLAAAIVTRRCALFTGAGLTADSGGSTWNDLIELLKKNFGYSSPLTDKFQMMDDMCRIYDKKKIYEMIVNRLKNAKLENPISKITTLPWFTIFTTNYDTALEDSLIENQKDLKIRRILTGKEYALTGLQSEILCVKLMGSLAVPFGQPGSMVLDIGELVTAREERAKMLNIVADHAANLSFLFVGYSFDDNIFIEILEKLINIIGQPKHKFYAVFKNEPDEKKAYWLRRFNIEFIVSDLKDFIEELSKQVTLRNPCDFSLKRVPLGLDVIPIDTTKVVNFLSFFNPVLFEDIEEEVSPNTFFKGDTHSFKPFSLGWHFERKEIKDVVKAVLKCKKNQSNIIKVQGSPGTGRTFIILAAVLELIRNHHSIAIEIQSYSNYIIPRQEDLEEFLQEIKKNAKKIHIEPERIVLWAGFPLTYENISQYKKSTAKLSYPVSLIFEGIASSQISEGIKEGKNRFYITVDDDLPKNQKENLSKYLLETVKKHKLPEINEAQVAEIIEEEEKFLPIMYRTLDPARRSINRIIQEEFNKISEPVVQDCISLISLASCIDIEMPIAILKKALGSHFGRLLTYEEIFEIATVKGKAFVKVRNDLRTNPLASIYHSIVAKRIAALVGKNRTDEFILDIACTVDLISQIEGDFIGSLLISNGVNWEPIPGYARPFSDDALESALKEIKTRQPARPILHHLARFYLKKNKYDKRIVTLLEEALAEPKEKYGLEERKENVLTTLASVKWSQNKKRFLKLPRNNPEIQEIIDILIEARRIVSTNVPPYDVHARILNELQKNKDEQERLPIISESLEVIDEGLDYCREDPEGIESLNILMIEILSKIDIKKAENAAKIMLENNKDGTGYYTLARIEYQKNKNPDGAIAYLVKALDGEIYPSEALALKIEILIHDKKIVDYYNLRKQVDLLSTRVDYDDSWKSAYYKAAIYVITGDYEDAVKFFRYSYKLAPWTLQRYINIFWVEEGHRKEHTGIIGRILTEREGRIDSHGIKGWRDSIYFDPRSQEEKSLLKIGLPVTFEVGFSPRGPIAFDVRPI